MNSRSRRSLLCVSAAAVGASIAGCLAGQRNSDETGDDSSQDDRDTTTDESSSDAGAKAKPLHLEVMSRSDESVEARLVLVALPEDEVVYDQAHTFEYGDTVWLGDHFEEGEDYRFELAIDGETRFSREIYSHEGYIIEISDPETVEIASQEER